NIERLGGLMKRERMPRTATAMIVGALAIAGLPPLNGFVSEWLMYIGLIDGALGTTAAASGVIALITVGLVTLVGGLAMICFVRLIGVALLGEPRAEEASKAHESPLSMTGPMITIAIACIGIALFPRAVLVAITRTVAQLTAATTTSPGVPTNADPFAD